ncbi:aminotransferase class I/II-fold pyridoxal phosphate-dependent enzyme [Amycolatopsis sp. SID8362]|uniref:8-amino-7-oxononanoate synthase family protein n=1 Tax=Amycolatopsis sp. SID8362 TaxID=2690346 RepID=UPI001370476F|nr:aminotransferase class I/II-fold pyridoxal phosphate-dependent enzyme [Amycolatopsis sp. SID8362]NBH01797.1 aminotransferase class I/II-fold pyridoxal phosphate-dependent enzyme [Amycolatopsis sp. SID8362]NED38499.1 aminotransferase class I/II-fold pyridoxal phosphate-dependent enzyme [Amycolatopsis sp. SID8362]
MHSFLNIKKSARISDDFWDVTDKAGLFDVVVAGLGDGRHRALADGHEFVNMSSYSYLGLDTHPKLVRAAADAVLAEGALNTSTSRMRVRFGALKDAEAALSELFDVEAVTLNSCAAAAWAALPLVASGIFTEGEPPLMVFDKNAHFCLNAMKPSVADETEVAVVPHNDVEALEALCKQHKRVAYVADGVYSTGGQAPVKELLALQEKYGLFLVFDEAHGISTVGHRGRGVVLEELGQINDRTIIITSLNKGFGASGGAIFLGKRGSQWRLDTAQRNGGPLMWSQRINTAGLGGLLASAELHRTDELTTLQQRLQDNIALFDRLVETGERGDGLPIRFVRVGSEDATVRLAQDLFRNGFYVSPIFFPIIGRGKAGLRIMLRASMTTAEIEQFAGLVTTLGARA